MSWANVRFLEMLYRDAPELTQPQRDVCVAALEELLRRSFITAENATLWDVVVVYTAWRNTIGGDIVAYAKERTNG